MNRPSIQLRRAQRAIQSVGLWTLILSLVGMAAPPVQGEDSEPEPFPPMPTMNLAPVDGVADVAAYTSAVADRATQLVALAEKSKNPLLRAELQLTGANLILARQIEPTCTRIFWRLTGPDEDPPGRKMLAQAFDTVDRLLAEAKTGLEEARGEASDDETTPADTGEAEEKPARVAAAGRHLRILASFQQALRAALLPPSDDDGTRTARRAASELAELVEHDDRRIATAAGFWQAYLRKGEADPHASLAGLDYALDEFAPTEQPYAFFSRVMRCDVLAGHDQVVAALTLLTQMEERALSWYPDEEPRQRALRAIAWTKLHALRTWHDTLDPNERAEERAWCSAQAATLVKDAFGEPNELPRLSPAIPLLLDADAVEAEAATGNDAAP